MNNTTAPAMSPVYVMQSQRDLVGWGATLPFVYGPKSERNLSEATAFGYRRIEGRTYYLVRFADGEFGVKVSYLARSERAYFKMRVSRNYDTDPVWFPRSNVFACTASHELLG